MYDFSLHRIYKSPHLRNDLEIHDRINCDVPDNLLLGPDQSVPLCSIMTVTKVIRAEGKVHSVMVSLYDQEFLVQLVD